MALGKRQIAPLDQCLLAYAHRQAGCKALMGHGIGPRSRSSQS